MDALRQANYVNDERYAELFAEQLVNKGFGPLSVRAKLRERGIKPQLIHQAIENLSTDWLEHACIVLLKRFDGPAIASRETKQEARISRFLASRGFDPGVSLRALRKIRSDLST